MSKEAWLAFIAVVLLIAVMMCTTTSGNAATPQLPNASVIFNTSCQDEATIILQGIQPPSSTMMLSGGPYGSSMRYDYPGDLIKAESFIVTFEPDTYYQEFKYSDHGVDYESMRWADVHYWGQDASGNIIETDYVHKLICGWINLPSVLNRFRGLNQ